MSDGISACSEGTNNSWTLTYARIYPQLADENKFLHVPLLKTHIIIHGNIILIVCYT